MTIIHCKFPKAAAGYTLEIPGFRDGAIIRERHYRYPEDLYLYMAFWVQKPGENIFNKCKYYLHHLDISIWPGTVSHIGIPTLQQNNINDMGEV